MSKNDKIKQLEKENTKLKNQIEGFKEFTEVLNKALYNWQKIKELFKDEIKPDEIASLQIYKLIKKLKAKKEVLINV